MQVPAGPVNVYLLGLDLHVAAILPMTKHLGVFEWLSDTGPQANLLQS